jgi:hypothetical protein
LYPGLYGAYPTRICLSCDNITKSKPCIVLPSTLSHTKDGKQIFLDGLFSNGFISPGPCLTEEYRNSFVYGGTEYKDICQKDLTDRLIHSPQNVAYVLRLASNHYLDGQPAWNENLPYKIGKLQYANNFVMYKEKEDATALDLTISTPIFSSSGIFLLPKEHSRTYPPWTRNQVLFLANKQIYPGEEIFVNYHWTEKQWQSIGGKYTHSYLKKVSAILWRETAVRYSYNFVTLRKNDELNGYLYGGSLKVLASKELNCSGNEIRFCKKHNQYCEESNDSYENEDDSEWFP